MLCYPFFWCITEYNTARGFCQEILCVNFCNFFVTFLCLMCCFRMLQLCNFWCLVVAKKLQDYFLAKLCSRGPIASSRIGPVKSFWGGGWLLAARGSCEPLEYLKRLLAGGFWDLKFFREAENFALAHIIPKTIFNLDHEDLYPGIITITSTKLLLERGKVLPHL